MHREGPLPPLKLTGEGHETLEHWPARSNPDHALTLRPRLALACVVRKTNPYLAYDLGVTKHTLRKCCSYFLAKRLGGLLNGRDRTRRGTSRTPT